MSDTTAKDLEEKDWAPESMEPDEHLDPDAPPAGVRRNQQDTRPVDGEEAIHQPQNGELGIRQPIQG